MPRFLPRSTQDYAIPRRERADFTHGAPALLEDIGRKMSVDMAHSEGRIPSPFSRSFVFYLNLTGRGLRSDGGGQDPETRLDRGREQLQAEARRTFRGLCATFALRRVLGIEIRQTGVLLSPTGRRIEQVLVSALQAAPRGEEYWNPMRFFTVRQSDGDPEVLAGLSPLTAIAPPARHPEHLTALYWYDPGNQETGRPPRWYDPTGTELSENGTFRLGNARTSSKVKRLLRAWVTRAIESLASATALQDFGMTPGDCTLLRNELRRWQGDLGGPLSDERLTVADPIPSDAGLPAPPTFLTFACEESPEHLLGDLPTYRGRLLVTREQLLSPSVRLYGRTFGNPRFSEVVEELGREGENLGADLGLGVYSVPMAYLFVDQLFEPKLTLVSEHGLSANWHGLSIGGEHYLFPFRPEVLNLLSPEELAAATKGERDRRGEHYIVTLRFGDVEIPQLYSVSDRSPYSRDLETIPPEHLDIRLYPNFDLDSVDAGALQPEDRRYYARIRLNPLWDFEISAFRYDAASRSVEPEVGQPLKIGQARVHGNPGEFHPGQVLLYTLEDKPTGFHVQDRGICLVELPVARQAPASWEVGIDFGTSNTCVTYRTEATRDPQVLRFPVLTTTLLRNPRYSVDFPGPQGSKVSEGASPLLDFFFRQQDTDEHLTHASYFPTQVVTRHAEVRPTWNWDHEGGLVYFRNVSLADPIIWELIESFPERLVGDPPRPKNPRYGKHFRLKQDIKWEQASWLKVFMRHLRREVLMAAAREGGTVKRLRFSYPKAFSFLQTEQFREVLEEVWNSGGTPDMLTTASESEAVQHYIVRHANEYVVFDVGGGTTDLTGFSNHKAIFQTSFRLAAGHINRYVVRSAAFRRAFLAAYEERFSEVPDAKLPVDMCSSFGKEAEEAGEDLLATVWLGLLEMVERLDSSGRKLLEILGSLRRMDGEISDPGVRAVRGFFLSLSLLFGGLAYYAGMLVRVASEGGFDGRSFSRRKVDLILTGNGSKLYTLLDHPEAPFRPVIQGMFLSGMDSLDETRKTAQANRDLTDPTAVEATGSAIKPGGATPEESEADALDRVGFEGLFKLNSRPAPKVTVALGLLTQPAAGIQAAQDDSMSIPVANIVGEEGYASSTSDSDLVEFYRGVHPRLWEFNPPKKAPPQLTRCLETLNRLLPKGINNRLPVIPRTSVDWHEPILGKLYPKSEVHIRARIAANANVLVSDLKNSRITEDDVPAQEPVFIVELAALLDQIREEHS